MTNYKSSFMLYLGLFIVGALATPMLASCGKSDTARPTNANAQLQIVNLSPDLRAFNLYGNFLRFNANAYAYGVASGYFLFPVADTPLQIRSVPTNSQVSQLNLLTLDSTLTRNVKYTWFVTGLKADSSVTSILTADTGGIPSAGRGKIRFVNASPNAASLRITANDTLAFDKVTYKKVTKYIEVTSGRYNFKLTSTSDPATILKSFDTTVLDGKLYTIYCNGLVGRADSAAFRIGVILNTIPDRDID